MTAPEQEQAVSGHPPDAPAIAAYAVHHGVPAEVAARYWAAESEGGRAHFRAMASAALDAAVALVARIPDGGSVVVAFRGELTEADTGELQERWGEYGPETVTLVLVDSVEAVTVVRDLAEAGPLKSGAEEFCVFWGGEDPDDCAGSQLYGDPADAEEDARWRVNGGIARRTVLRGGWTVIVPPDPEGDAMYATAAGGAEPVLTALEDDGIREAAS